MNLVFVIGVPILICIGWFLCRLVFDLYKDDVPIGTAAIPAAMCIFMFALYGFVGFYNSHKTNATTYEIIVENGDDIEIYSGVKKYTWSYGRLYFYDPKDDRVCINVLSGTVITKEE